MVHNMQNDTVPIQQGHPHEWTAFRLQHKHLAWLRVPQHRGQIQVKHDRTAIAQRDPAIARQRELERLHHGVREGQKPVKPCIKHCVNVVWLLGHIKDDQIHNSVALGRDAACDHGGGTVTPPPRRYAAAEPMRSP